MFDFFHVWVLYALTRPELKVINSLCSEFGGIGGEDRKHNVPFRQIVKIRIALFQTFGWRAGSSWVVVQADTYKLTSCFLSVL